MILYNLILYILIFILLIIFTCSFYNIEAYDNNNNNLTKELKSRLNKNLNENEDNKDARSGKYVNKINKNPNATDIDKIQPLAKLKDEMSDLLESELNKL